MQQATAAPNAGFAHARCPEQVNCDPLPAQRANPRLLGQWMLIQPAQGVPGPLLRKNSHPFRSRFVFHWSSLNQYINIIYIYIHIIKGAQPILSVKTCQNLTLVVNAMVFPVALFPPASQGHTRRQHSPGYNPAPTRLQRSRVALAKPQGLWSW